MGPPLFSGCVLHIPQANKQINNAGIHPSLPTGSMALGAAQTDFPAPSHARAARRPGRGRQSRRAAAPPLARGRAATARGSGTDLAPESRSSAGGRGSAAVARPSRIETAARPGEERAPLPSTARSAPRLSSRSISRQKAKKPSWLSTLSTATAPTRRWA